MIKTARCPKTLAAVHPNAGIEADYREKIERMVDDMNASIMWWVRSAYRANTPAMAMDESPAAAMRKVMADMTRQWQRNFEEAAPALGKWFAAAATDRSDRAMKGILKKAGFSVKFTMTRAANDVIQATTGENVSLIKSIASQHLSEVEGLVMRSVAAGRDLGTLTKDLELRYGITRRRAALVARDQNNKATASITRVRQEGLGITEAVWRHSHGGRHPRPSHVRADGDTYKVAEGMLIDGRYIWPGTEINCRCVSRPVIPGF